MLSRREFIKGLGASLILPAGLAASSNSVNLHHVRLTYQDLPVDFRGYRIAFISDIHHGPFLPPEWFYGMLKYLKHEFYDLLLLGGDYLHTPDSLTKRHIYPWHNQSFNRFLSKQEMIDQIFKELSAEISGLSPEDKIYAIYGNHDQWLAPEVTRSSFQKNNIQLLVNKTITIKRGQAKLNIFGADDYWTGFPTNPEFPTEPQNINCILAHNPDYISDLLKARQHFHLALCGHTHGGQINLPLIGGIHNNIKDQRFISGLQKTKENQYVFTSRGIGTVEIPYRWNCPPEVVILTFI